MSKKNLKSDNFYLDTVMLCYLIANTDLEDWKAPQDLTPRSGVGFVLCLQTWDVTCVVNRVAV
jgi:hypothetical protein